MMDMERCCPDSPSKKGLLPQPPSPSELPELQKGLPKVMAFQGSPHQGLSKRPKWAPLTTLLTLELPLQVGSSIVRIVP